MTSGCAKEIPPLERDERLGGHARRMMAIYEPWLNGKPVAVPSCRMLGLFDRPAGDGRDRGASSAAVIRRAHGCGLAVLARKRRHLFPAPPQGRSRRRMEQGGGGAAGTWRPFWPWMGRRRARIGSTPIPLVREHFWRAAQASTRTRGGRGIGGCMSTFEGEGEGAARKPSRRWRLSSPRWCTGARRETSHEALDEGCFWSRYPTADGALLQPWKHAWSVWRRGRGPLAAFFDPPWKRTRAGAHAGGKIRRFVLSVHDLGYVLRALEPAAKEAAGPDADEPGGRLHCSIGELESPLPSTPPTSE